MTAGSIAVVGAGGCVGREMLELLAGSPHVSEAPLLYGSSRSRGATLPFRDRELPVRVLGEDPLPEGGVALFAAGGDVSRAWAQSFVERGVTVIDNSSAFRLDPEVPLVVPEINGHQVTAAPGIIANPNCSTIILLLAVHPLMKLGRCEICCATYQAVSGAGRAGLEALARERGGHPFRPGQPFPFPIAGNLFPLIGSIDEHGNATEEHKMVAESRKILGIAQLQVYVTCVRVPIERCHSEAITLLYEYPVNLEEARQQLGQAAGLTFEADPERPPLPGPLARSHLVHVGRLRQPAPRVLQLWAVGDQLLKGAALNAVQIAELCWQS